jgi:hypothetical protein
MVPGRMRTRDSRRLWTEVRRRYTQKASGPGTRGALGEHRSSDQAPIRCLVALTGYLLGTRLRRAFQNERAPRISERNAGPAAARGCCNRSVRRRTGSWSAGTGPASTGCSGCSWWASWSRRWRVARGRPSISAAWRTERPWPWIRRCGRLSGGEYGLDWRCGLDRGGGRKEP